MSKSGEDVTIPRSVRHKRILELAKADPEASIDELAAEVPSATAELVEQVLDEYGDPGADQFESTAGPKDPDLANGQDRPAFEELTDKQREILRLIQQQPEATQQTLADRLDVCPATVSNRVNAIPGFEWTERAAFANAVLNGKATAQSETASQPMSNQLEKQTVEQLADQLNDLEHRIEELAAVRKAASGFDDPELVHKVLHACLESTAISEEEELRILKDLLE